MRTRSRVLGVVLTGAALALPSLVHAEIYAWRTDDGVYAYTDDPERIPARYADQAVAVRDTHLGSYARLTRQDSAAAAAVSARLQQRLEYLRKLNASAPGASAAANASAPGRTTVTVATGSPQAPTLDISTDANAEPIVVEPVVARKKGDLRTRHTTVVRQGDHTLAVLKGGPTETNPSTGIYDEDELVDGKF
jgi:Domain of unknown function (DUF4124)